MTHEKRGPRVAEEAAALRAGRHPGVLELVDAEGEVLRTRPVEGRPLSELGPLPTEEVAGVVAAVAATLADLHDLGVVHGGLDASHVIVSEDGRPVLCSLGRGGQPADDVAALGRLILSMTGEAASDPLRARLRLRHPRRARRRRLGTMLSPVSAPALADLATQATRPDPAHRPTARGLVVAIRERIPGARLPRLGDQPSEDRPSPSSPRPKLPWALPRAGLSLGPVGLGLVGLGLVGLGLLGAVVLGVFSWTAGDDGRHTSPPPPAAHGDMAATVGPTRVWPTEPMQYEQGVLTYMGARYAVGQPGDALVAADWGCTGRVTLALLRPSNGQVFVFDSWAGQTGGTGEVTARPVGQVDGGTGLGAVDVDGDGCLELEVARRDEAPAHLDVAR